MLDMFKKKGEDFWLAAEYDYLNNNKRVLDEFVYTEGFRGFKRMQISSKYPEAEKNLKSLIKRKPTIPAKDKYSGETLDLSNSKISICLAENKTRDSVLMIYVDGLFIGSNIPGKDGKPAAILAALKKHKVTAAHLEIRFGKDINRKLAFDNYLMVNNVNWND